MREWSKAGCKLGMNVLKLKSLAFGLLKSLAFGLFQPTQSDFRHDHIKAINNLRKCVALKNLLRLPGGAGLRLFGLFIFLLLVLYSLPSNLASLVKVVRGFKVRNLPTLHIHEQMAVEHWIKPLVPGDEPGENSSENGDAQCNE